jgi:hypothetical protein
MKKTDPVRPQARKTAGKSNPGAGGTSVRRPASKSTKPVVTRSAGLDLSSLFGAAAQALTANQPALNQMDTENQNHGDNMVQTFNLITQALAGQSGGTPTQQLTHASQYLAAHADSGSAHVYSQGLAQAAQQMQGQPSLTPANAGMLIQALLGDGTNSSGGADMLGSLLGGSQGSSGGGDLLGGLLGGVLTGQQAADKPADGLDLGDVLNAGLTFMNAKQQGQSTLQAALSAIMASGPMSQKPYRQQSGQVVANALLQALSGMTSQR